MVGLSYLVSKVNPLKLTPWPIQRRSPVLQLVSAKCRARAARARRRVRRRRQRRCAGFIGFLLPDPWALGACTPPQNISTYTFRGLGIHFIQNVCLGHSEVYQNMSPPCLPAVVHFRGLTAWVLWVPLESTWIPRVDGRKKCHCALQINKRSSSRIG